MDFKLHTGNTEWGRGGLVNEQECGRHRSVILQINREIGLFKHDVSTNFDIDCRYFPILADLLFRETFRYKSYFNPEEAGFQIFINSNIEYDYFAGSSVVASGKVSWCLT